MLLKITRFVSILCAALVFGLTITHPGKQMVSVYAI
jgi:hypothetical protein